MLESFEERCDNCLYSMRNMEGEEARQEIWFDLDTVEEKKRNMLAAVLGMDFFTYEGEVVALDNLEIIIDILIVSGTLFIRQFVANSCEIFLLFLFCLYLCL